MLKKLFAEMSAGWQSLVPEEQSDINAEERARFLGFWEEHRRIFGYTLLSELPYRLRAALQQHPDLEGIDYDALVVDEYQDLNACDLDVLKSIAARGCAIIAVGDDDQSIYSFRKAAPEGIRRFLCDYPGSADYRLSVSMRCSRSIIEWANHVILGDTGRKRARPLVQPRENALAGEVALL